MHSFRNKEILIDQDKGDERKVRGLIRGPNQDGGWRQLLSSYWLVWSNKHPTKSDKSV